MIEYSLVANPKTKKPKKIVGNVITALSQDKRWQGVIAYDTFRETIVIRRQPPQRFEDTIETQVDEEWSLEHTVRTVAWLMWDLDLDVTNGMVRDAVAVVARQNLHHPVREYLDTLTWDGKSRVDTFFTRYCGAEDNPYTRDVARVAFLSSIARILEPGCKVDTIPILEGPQGLQKSTLIRSLAGRWFSDTPLDLRSKDAYQNLRGVQIQELAEIGDMFRGHEANRTKNFTSSATDYYRPPYAERPVSVPRQCVFWGTTNEAGYFADHTGGRRFLPVQVRRLDIEAVRRDRDQLWAESHVRRLQLEQYWPNDTIKVEREAEQSKRFRQDAWQDLVEAWLESPKYPTAGGLTTSIDLSEGFAMWQVLYGAVHVPPERQGHNEQARMAKILDRLGWATKSRKRDESGKRSYFWFKTEIQ